MGGQYSSFHIKHGRKVKFVFFKRDKILISCQYHTITRINSGFRGIFPLKIGVRIIEC